MKKITKKLAVIALSTTLLASAGVAVGTYAYMNDAVTASADVATKIDLSQGARKGDVQGAS